VQVNHLGGNPARLLEVLPDVRRQVAVVFAGKFQAFEHEKRSRKLTVDLDLTRVMMIQGKPSRKGRRNFLAGRHTGSAIGTPEGVGVIVDVEKSGYQLMSQNQLASPTDPCQGLSVNWACVMERSAQRGARKVAYRPRAGLVFPIALDQRWTHSPCAGLQYVDGSIPTSAKSRAATVMRERHSRITLQQAFHEL
jgi:hypothetical protein